MLALRRVVGVAVATADVVSAAVTLVECATLAQAGHQVGTATQRLFRRGAV